MATLLVLGLATPPAAKITIDHNTGSAANRNFKFKNLPSPAKDDPGAKAKLTLVDGEIDSNGADLTALTDGILPTEEDEPGASFFFNAGTDGGRFRLDLGTILELAQVNTYSWHPNTRGPQLYKLLRNSHHEFVPESGKFSKIWTSAEFSHVVQGRRTRYCPYFA